MDHKRIPQVLSASNSHHQTSRNRLYLKYLNNEEEGTYVEFESEKINGKTIFSNFLKTKDGFTISTNFKMGVLEYSIDQSGLIKRNDI